MNQLLGYRAKLIARLQVAADEFCQACLAVEDPFKAVSGSSWNTHQLATHTRDVEKVVYDMRIRRTAREDTPEFQEFDPDAWISTTYTVDEPLASILDDFSASVKETGSMLRELPPEGWSRESSHEIYGGGFTLQTWVERGLAHIEEHSKTLRNTS